MLAPIRDRRSFSSPARWLPLALIGGLWPAAAAATPADVFVLLDTSGSMARPLGGETRLAAAKKVAADVIKAVQDRHRVGLARFAQLQRVVAGGEGKQLAFGEDPKQCDRGSNLLVGMDVAGAAEALRWVDGVDELGNPEVVAVGDSPLARGVEAAVQYIRNKRKADPLRHCVNALLVVITDGVDTCAGGAEVRGTLAELAARAQQEDIRTLVLSYTANAEAALAVAQIGDPTGKPYSAAEAEKLVAAAKALNGRLAPEACIASGVPAAQIGYTGGGGSKKDAGTCAAAGDSGCSCAVAERRASRWPGAALLLAGLLLAVIVRRRQRTRGAGALLIALAAGGLWTLAGCGSDAKPGCPADSGTGDGRPPAAGLLQEPTVVRDTPLAKLPTLLAAAEAARRDVFAPLLDPDKVFAAIKDQAGCLDLARGLGFEPYHGVQRGAAGCLATRRCNSFDKALLLQACLKAKGVTADLKVCNTPPEALRQQLLAAAAKPTPAQDLTAATAKEKEVVRKLLAAADVAKFEKVIADRDAAQKKVLATNVAADVAALLPLAGLDAAATDTQATARVEAAVDRHAYIVSGGKALDPTIAGSAIETGSCDDGALDLAKEAVQLTVEVVLGYVGGPGNWRNLDIVAATTTIAPYTAFGKTLAMGVADASAAQLGAAIPPAATSGCLRAFLELGDARVQGPPFHIGPTDAASCPVTPLAKDEADRRLSRVTLRLTTVVAGKKTIVERVLVDRHGYAQDEKGARASGPMYSDTTARKLLPLRVDLLVVSGLLSPAALLDVHAADLIARRAQIEAELSARAGLPAPLAPPGPPPPVPQAILGLVNYHAAEQLGSGMLLVAERPWLLSQVRRRGFGAMGAALDVVEQTIVDVLDAPLLVARAVGASADAAARLKAQVAVGALVTEAETLAAYVGGAREPVSAATMLRDPALAGKWALLDTVVLDFKLFPWPVREAAADYSSQGDLLISTPGAVPVSKTDSFLAWWRVEKATGRTIGELRFEGTFYGGVPGMMAAAELIVDLDKCLYAGATAALMGAEECDLSPCFKQAFDHFKMNVAISLAGAAFFGYGHYAGWSHSPIFEAAEFTFEVGVEAIRGWFNANKLGKCVE